MIILSENGPVAEVELPEGEEIPSGFTAQDLPETPLPDALSEDQHTILMLQAQIEAYRYELMTLRYELAQNQPPF